MLLSVPACEGCLSLTVLVPLISQSNMLAEDAQV